MGQNEGSKTQETKEPYLKHNILKDHLILAPISYVDIEAKQSFIGICSVDAYYILIPLVGDGKASHILATHILSGLNEYFKQQSE